MFPARRGSDNSGVAGGAAGMLGRFFAGGASGSGGGGLGGGGGAGGGRGGSAEAEDAYNMSFTDMDSFDQAGCLLPCLARGRQFPPALP